MDRLAKITTGDLLSSGVFPSLKGEAAPFWKEGENLVFDNGGVRKMPGLFGLVDTPAVPTGLRATVAGQEPRCFVGAGASAYRYRSSDGLTAVATFASPGGVYDFVPWDTWALVNNGIDPVKLWQNAGMAADIVAPFTRANVIFGYQTQVFAAGTNNGGQLVEWSPINVVSDWTPTLSNTAGNLRLRALNGDVVAAKPIGGSIGIYSNVNAGLFTYTGGSLPYAFQRPLSGVSAISKYSVVSRGDRHYGLTQDNAFVTDLVSFLLIDEPAMRRYIAENADWDRVQEVYGWNDFANCMVRWSVPKLTGGTFGIGFRTDKQTWTYFNDNVRLGEDTGPFTNMLLAKSGKLLRQDKLGLNNDGTALGAYARTKPLDLGSRNRYKRIAMVSLDMEWSGDVRVKLGFSNHPNEDPVWVVDQAAANEIFIDRDNAQAETIYLSLQISCTAVDAGWKLSGGEIYGKMAGYAHA